MHYYATIQIDLEATSLEDATRQAGSFADRICNESFCDCARVSSIEAAPQCTCVHLFPFVVHDPGCPVHRVVAARTDGQ